MCEVDYTVLEKAFLLHLYALQLKIYFDVRKTLLGQFLWLIPNSPAIRETLQKDFQRAFIFNDWIAYKLKT